MRLRRLASIGAVATFALATVFAETARGGDHARLDLVREPDAPSCPDAQGLSDAVASRLGYPPFVADAPLSVAVRFARDGAGLGASVAMYDAQGGEKGARTLRSEALDCRELAEATALTISILLDPRAGLAPRPLQKPPEPTPAEVPDLSHPLDPTASAPPPQIPQPPAPRAYHLDVDVRAGGSLGLLPTVAPMFTAGVGVAGRSWLVGAEFRLDAPASKSSAGHEVTASFVGGDLAPCVRLSIAHACAVVALGALTTSLSGVSQTRQSAFMTLVGPRVGVDVSLTSWLSVLADVDTLFAPIQTSVVLDGAPVWSTGVVSGALRAGLRGTIP